MAKITDKAKGITGFEKLPITSQVSLLYREILEARQFRIPLAAICAALNEAGSKVTVRYFREVLFVLRKSHEVTFRHHDVAPQATDSKSTTVVDDFRICEDNLSPSVRRQKKAEFYLKSNNPLLNNLNKSKD